MRRAGTAAKMVSMRWPETRAGAVEDCRAISRKVITSIRKAWGRIVQLAQAEAPRARPHAIASPRPSPRRRASRDKPAREACGAAYVRALPLKADAAIPLEEVITTYQKRAEESLLREEIPPNNRDLVRAYFLAIGLVEEVAGSEGKDEQRER